MFLENNMASQAHTLSSEQLQALFTSITTQQSQADSSFYLPHLSSDQERETQLEADGKAGEDRVVPRIPLSSDRENKSGKQLEIDKELFLSVVSTNLIAITKVLEAVVANVNYINKVLYGVLFRTSFYQPFLKSSSKEDNQKLVYEIYIYFSQRQAPAAAKIVLFSRIMHAFHPLAIATESPILDAMFIIYFCNLYCNIRCILLL